ncbi:D-serine ammonia-lyase [Tepidanaerobacter acetatoxydans Re1]|uniref:Probable D-serine dehydratase n=1 Tax=Tepidanaerobacter acetatoxydans (strain DSM 21804 / JCM 16047 / Re1) TaxID=1209989 RepID=F4LRP0_TEPAE|nr:D-serine ammonia-lyase [Tepidanaerobacter acetatoxydans]AEE91108.1 D-serine dehydratase [Tepidanaerobacter acetatoxydans Re1]CCP25760.1 D-serine ammonia-lyase [Tepidanaerobacter acetatoxydans Re1]
MNVNIKTLIEEFPILKKLMNYEEILWINDKKQPTHVILEQTAITEDMVTDAEQRLDRFAPCLEEIFPETRLTNGIIESPIKPTPRLGEYLDTHWNTNIKNTLYLKCDNDLPISGSIKARGGIYEVLKYAEDVALKNNKLKRTDNYKILATPEFRKLFGKYSIAVGSTGNLGLSIGIIGAALGFQTTVHMSQDARQWKKDMLREKGVTVIEYENDYSVAVAKGRKQAEGEPNTHFVDDENSIDLFLGYAVVARRIKKQLLEANIVVDDNHPLFVYLPCGVGGGPGGVAYGLKQVYGDLVHCFFAEPTHAPCMILGMVTNLHNQISVQDIGIDNKTAADGLAVGRASSFVGKTLKPLLSGSYTLSDERIYRYLANVYDLEGIQLEPSALAGLDGPRRILTTYEGQNYLKREGLDHIPAEHFTHLVWATGGKMVPKDIFKEYYKLGK